MGNNHKYDNRIIFHPDGVQMKFLKEAADFAGCDVEMVLKVIVTSWLCQYQLLKPEKDRKNPDS